MMAKNEVEEEEEEESDGDDYDYEEVEAEAEVEDEDDVEVDGSDEDENAPEDEELDDDEDVIADLQDDPDDPNYTAQKKLLEDTLPGLRAAGEYKENLRSKEDEDGLSDVWRDTFEGVFEDVLTKEEIEEADARADAMSVEVEDLEGLTGDDADEAYGELDDETGEDAFPSDGPMLESRGLTNANLVEIDAAAREYFDTQRSMKDGTWEGFKPFDLIDEEAEWERLNLTDPVQFEECEEVLEEMDDDDRPIAMAEKLLLYDLNFDVANLFLAACNHNPDAPIILPQWLYQLECYSRYHDVQSRNFEIDWEEAEKADMSELLRYWTGLGYEEIPTRTSQETNMIKIEPPDFDDLQMSHMQEWMKEVYNPEFDEVFFDDDAFMPYDSVFSEEYYQKDPPKDQVEMDKLIKEFKDDVVEAGNMTDTETKEMYQYMDNMVSVKNFTQRTTHDSPEAAEFQGHLVVACSELDVDLEIAEKITQIMEREFGKRVFVETRVYKHARPEDYVFEVWLESYDIDLLHSKRKATFSTVSWDGPAECDAEAIDYLVEEVRYLISDDHRYSYRIFEYEGIEEG